MRDAYWICLGIGIVIPLISIFFDFIDGACDLIAFDFDFLPDIEIDFLPITSYSISMGLILFGGLGLLLSNSMPLVKVNIISGVCGYIGAILVQNCIRYLKKQKHFAVDKTELYENDAVVTNTILKGAFGSVTVTQKDSGVVTTPAKSIGGEELRQGTKVRIIEVKDSYVVVGPYVQETELTGEASGSQEQKNTSRHEKL